MNSKLFNASCFALVTTAMTFAVRAKIELVFNNDYGLTLEQIGIAFGPAFYGFTIAMIIGGFLVDLFGMKKIMNLAFIGHLVGIVLTLFARDFWMLFSGTLLIGIGNGMVEAACNPLIATLYPKEKTKMLNRFHVWFPGGIVIGSILGYFIVDIMGMSWMVLVGTLFIPLVIYIYLFKGQEFPATERVASGVTYNDMLKACFAFFSASFEIDTSFFALAFLIVICLFSFVENVFSRSFFSFSSISTPIDLNALSVCITSSDFNILFISHIPFDIDGIIITTNDLHKRNTSGNPDYAFAFKAVSYTHLTLPTNREV